MSAWEHANQTLRASALAATFTPEEFAHLHALREHYQTTQDCSEFGLDSRRLRFVCWLVAHGRLSEGIEAA